MGLLERRKVAWESNTDEREGRERERKSRLCGASRARFASVSGGARMCGYEARGWKLCIK